MNFFQKRFLTLAAFIANISLTLVVAGVATFAWFTTNMAADMQVSSNGMQITTKDPEEQLTYEILKYDDNIKAGRSYTGSDAIAQFTLPDYDTYITEKNQYANVILRAEVTTSALNTSKEELTIDITRLASSFKTAGVIGSNTSNVIQFKSTVYKYKISEHEEYTNNPSSLNSIDETNAATKYATASSYFASKKTPTTFVPIRDSGDGTVIVNRKTEADTITLIPDLPTGLTLTSVIVYIECTYHETLVNEFIDSHSGSDMSYILDGDISLIKFGKQTKTANVSHATGKYIKVESEATASSGQYLPTYEPTSGSGKILKGSLATANAGLGNGIDIRENYRPVAVNASTATEPQSIDSTDAIDKEAFAYDRTAHSLKSASGFYIGNSSGSNGIQTNSSLTGLTNTVTFSEGHPVVTASGGKVLKFNATAGEDRFRYLTGGQNVDLYRYTENVAEMPTLVSIAITGTPTSAQRTFYTNHTFNLNGLEVTATYSDSSTAVVTHSCSFTSPNGVTTLIPEGRTSPTTFTTAEANKTVNISYSEGAVTLTNAASYTINIEDEAITSLTKEGSLSTTNYYVGDTFSSTGLTVYGEYNSGIEHADVTSSCTFDGYNMSVAGSYTVVAHYNGLNINVGTIIVRTKTLEISVDSSDVSGQTLNLYYTESLTIKVTHTANVTIERSGTYATPSAYSVAYSGATHASQDHNITVTAGSTSGTTTLTFSVASPSGFNSKTVNIRVREMPVDTLTITATNPTWSTSGYASGNYNATTGKSTQITLSASNVMNQSGKIQIKDASNAGFTSTTTTGQYIKSIAVDWSAGNSYILYASANGSSWTTIGTYSGDNTSTFTESNGYKYFRIYKSGGYVAFTSVTVQYYTVSVVDVTGIHTQPSSYYVNDTPSVNDFLLDVTMSDDTTSTVVPTSISLNTSVAGNNISGTATYSGASGTKTASFTINIINRLVTGITVNLSSSTVGVGGSATATATIIPSNATTKTVTWSSSDTGVATINASTGAISAVAAGTCTFTATATDGSNITGTSSTFTVKEVHTVTYQPNGGTGSYYVVSNVLDGSSHTLVSFATSGFTAPSGKEFKCWSVGGVEKDPGTSITVNANTTVLAVWKDASTGYVISYDGNGSTGGTAVSANSAGNYVLQSNTWDRSGCTFVGWAVNTGSGYVKMAAGATVTGITGNITVKAIWQSKLVITRSSFSNSGGYSWYSWTQSTNSGSSISGQGYLYTTTTASMQFNKSKGNAALFNTTALPGKITKIEAQTASGTNRAWNAYVTSTACSVSNSTLTYGSNKTTVGSSVTISTSLTSIGTSTAGYSYFCVEENVNSASYLANITVTYEIW